MALSPNLQSKLLSWRWPKEIDQLRISYLEKRAINAFLELAIPQILLDQSPYQNITKHRIIGINNKLLTLPISIYFVYNTKNQCEDIILLLNRKKGGVVGAGSQCSPKICFSLLMGKKIVKKPICHNELPLIKTILAHPNQGLPTIIGIRETLDKKTLKNKVHYFETLFEHSLSSLIGTPKLNSASLKLFYIIDLLAGLSALQSFQFTQELKFKTDRSQETKSFNFFCLHRDLKPDNILIKGSNAVIIDFGFSNILEGFAGTYPYMSPSMVSKNLSDATNFEIISYNVSYGKAFDIWSLGVCIAVIILNSFSNLSKFKHQKVPPLRFLENRLDPNSSLPNRRFVDLKQDEVDREIEMYKAQCNQQPNSQVLYQLWTLVGKMLRDDPQKTISSKEALHYAKEILEKDPFSKICSDMHKAQQAFKEKVQMLKQIMQSNWKYQGKISLSQSIRAMKEINLKTMMALNSLKSRIKNENDND